MIICADDYGLDAPTNSSILQLLEQKKITSVSVLVRNLLPEDAQKLKRLSPQIGLHVDLFCRWNEKTPAAEISSQISLFRRHFGFLPQHYDGHRHCHIYPVYRTALIHSVLRQPEHTFYIRSLTMPQELRKTNSLKHRLYLQFLSRMNSSFVSLLAKHRIRTNTQVFGAFNCHQPVSVLHRLAVRTAGPQDLFFCHPGVSEDYEYLRQA